MSTVAVGPDASPGQPVEILSALRGRLRIHLSNWGGKASHLIQTQVRSIAGVQSARANPLTGNILVYYDATQTSEDAVLDALYALAERLPQLETGTSETARRPSTHVLRDGEIVRARIAVRGLDRNPQVARHVVDVLERLPGVRAHASPLTSRVLVEYREHDVELDDIIAEVMGVEMPEMPGEDRPADPLDPAPLIQSATRTVGTALGLGLLAAQRMFRIPELLVDPTIPANISGVISILRGFPFLRNGLRRLIGNNAADVSLALPNIATLTLANSPLGLAVTGAESVTLLSEVRSRQAAWRHYETHLQHIAAATPGSVVRLESREITPLESRVLEGTGTYVGRSGQPEPVSPGVRVPPGARLIGGPFVLEMLPQAAFEPQMRPAPLLPTIYERYIRGVAPLSLGYALLTAIFTRSLSRTFAALLLVNPRVAVIGMEMANLDAAMRVLRAGVVIANTRPDRTLRRPDVVLLDGPRVLTDHFEVNGIIPLQTSLDTTELLALVGGVASASGSPWGGAFRTASGMEAEHGHFDGFAASARIHGVQYTLGHVDDVSSSPEAGAMRQRGDCILQLRREGISRPLGLVALRPGLSAHAQELVTVCRQHHVMLALLPAHDTLTAYAVARRSGIPVLDSDDALAAIQSRQALGQYIAYVSDGAHAGMAFDACDLAIGLTDGRNPIGARADLLAPDLAAVAAVVEAGARRDVAVRDSVAISVASNVFGAIWGFRSAPGVQRASTIVYGAALAAIADGWWRLRGGDRQQSSMSQLTDPNPERWGMRSIARALGELHTSENGLSTPEAQKRRHQAPVQPRQKPFLARFLTHVRSPLNSILAIGAGVSLVLGAPADVAIIGLTIGANSLIGAWQERRASQVIEALDQLAAANARVLRDGQPVIVPAGEIVPGDVLLLAPGDRVIGDALLIESQALEVDEAALTGESFPVVKMPYGASEAARVVLDGSDVTTGSGRAVVFAVGRETRMGSIAATLSASHDKGSPLDRRLSELLGQVLPVALAGGAIVTGAGWLRTRALVPELAIGATIALAAMPEGLPLLTRISEAGVARRLASQNSLTRRLPAVEALGRVDVACTDKTGTLTQGHLALRLVAEAIDSGAGEVYFPLMPGQGVSTELRGVMRAAALASPHPGDAGASAHPTDVAVTRGAEAAGLGDEIRIERDSELPFDPARAFHAAIVAGHLYVKGAPEALIPRCVAVRRASDAPGGAQATLLDAASRERLMARAETLGSQGLRVLMVAERSQKASVAGESSLDDPRELVALGFIGISDPLKPTVPSAVRRCRDAGVRVIMLTGDHPSTARVIAREAGLLDGDEQNGAVLTGSELGRLDNGELDTALARAVVIARATPLDKVRIVASLQRTGRTVAMTGDGVNDSPALRLADVGFAMGRGGTEVARQAADVVLADDDFSTLVEALVEGRSFWHNIRRALGLLLGGNLGELGLVVGASAVGLASPMTARQILVVNIITDILPGLAIALRQPAHRNLGNLSREGASALDKPLTREVLRRGALTAGPSLAAYALSLATGTVAQAQTVAFATVVGTQLAQTLDMGWTEGTVTAPILGAVIGSAGLTASAITLSPLRNFLRLALPNPLGWGLIGSAVLVAFVLSRLMSVSSPDVSAVPPGVSSVPPPRLVPVLTYGN